MEPCDDDVQTDKSDDDDSTDQSDESVRQNCVKIIDSDIELTDFEFYDGIPIICRDQIRGGFPSMIIICIDLLII